MYTRQVAYVCVFSSVVPAYSKARILMEFVPKVREGARLVISTNSTHLCVHMCVALLHLMRQAFCVDVCIMLPA